LSEAEAAKPTHRNLVFAGTPGFAEASLRALVQAGMAPLLVLTRPDRPAGRGRKLRMSPVKRYAAEQGIPVSQPENLKDPAQVTQLYDLKPEAIVVAAYGLIFPPEILALPAHGCVNVHASLLPRWRGAAPIQAAILNGDSETGISLMRMDRGLDTGPVYVQQALAIRAGETAGSLHDRLAVLGGELLTRYLPSILDGRMDALPQDERLASFARKIDKAAARLDFRLQASELERRVRAYNPEPGAWFMLDGERVKCWAAETAVAAAWPGPDSPPAGTIVAAGRSGLEIACGQGVIRLLELQRPGRGRITASQFAGRDTVPGTQLAV
jgi:methionyl-tRNA formyltransferase